MTPPHLARPRPPWWTASLVGGLGAAGLVASALSTPRADPIPEREGSWWLVTLVAHVPFAVILLFLTGGLIERLGYFWRGRRPASPGRLPDVVPSVCVQLPMFNEHAVARRIIEAAAALRWPAGGLTVQVLDDSTDAATRSLVATVCAEVARRTGVNCHVVRRIGRAGYKAGALEAGRRRTDAEFIVIFDADFVPPGNFLQRAIAHFYDVDARPDEQLAMVQTQWGHLNHDESMLTKAQSLWVDDHHTLQMSWRAANWGFVNFTGTAGVWRASAVEAAGGWRAASLVEDCELSFRHLFAGYRTTFVKEIVVPAELPATYTAYKAQQRRWTQGWVQLQRLHLGTLLRRFPCSPLRRLHLLYHMCIAWQWPAWAAWAIVFPALIHRHHWFGAVDGRVGLALYLGPPALWIGVSVVAASIETRHTYLGARTPAVVARRVGRVVPYLVINTGMLPHQCSAFLEGLFGGLHSEFERTPKAATVTAIAAPGAHGMTSVEPPTTIGQRASVKIHWPYVIAEIAFVGYQLLWAVVFALDGVIVGAIGASYLAACVLVLAYFYGDHAGRVGFVFERRSNPVNDQRLAA